MLKRQKNLYVAGTYRKLYNPSHSDKYFTKSKCVTLLVHAQAFTLHQCKNEYQNENNSKLLHMWGHLHMVSDLWVGTY